MSHQHRARAARGNSPAFLIFFFAFILLNTTPTHAMVDMRNANFSESWIDVQISSSTYDLRVQRTYNSRTLFNGMFGFGWCSDFETTLKVTSENSLRLTECGAGFEMDYTPTTSAKSLEGHIRELMTEYKAHNRDKTAAQLKAIETDLRIDPALREEFSRQFKLSSRVQANTIYAANGRAGDTIEFKNNEYTRRLANGSLQKFNQRGQLILVSDQNNNFLKILYAGDQISSVASSSTLSLQFKYDKNSKLVKQVLGPNGLTATYTYKGENLVSMTNAWKNTYTYEYDELYNMTRANYPDKTYLQITYNKDKDWVTKFRDRMGCIESYDYTDGAQDPVNNYKSAVKKVCNGKTTNVSSYEFWHKIRKDGVRYLERTLAVNNGQAVDTTYHELFGRPILIKQDGHSMRMEYNSRGQMLKKTSELAVHLYKYNESCNKVSAVSVENLSTPSRSNASRDTRQKASAREVLNTEFYYDPKRCNLMSAKNSSGQTVSLSYDLQGRITKIVDQSKKLVTITYDERFGKPLVVNRPGLGSIHFKYKDDGSVDKFDSPDAPIVAMQVASIFSNLLEIISPATTDSNNI